MKTQACSSYVPSGICKSGFPYPRTSACHGGDNTCHSCGKPSDKIPPCQNEDLGRPWLNDDGYPRHIKVSV